MSVTSASSLRLGDHFARDLPEMAIAWIGEPAPNPWSVVLDETLAAELGLAPTWLRSTEGLRLLTGTLVPDGATPVAQARNHLVEEALSAATNGELTPLERLLEAVAAPYDERPGLERYAQAAPPDFGPYRTFCGT